MSRRLMPMVMVVSELGQEPHAPASLRGGARQVVSQPLPATLQLHSDLPSTRRALQLLTQQNDTPHQSPGQQAREVCYLCVPLLFPL